MNDNWFLWNGVDSRTMGIVVDLYPPRTRPEERTEQIIVPGRHGALTFVEDDEPMYNTFILTADCFLRRGADPGQVAAWLTGSGKLVIGETPDRFFEARIIKNIDYTSLVRHRKLASFSVPFQCQPLRGQYPEPSEITISEITPETFDSTKAYAVGDRVRYDGANYLCTTAHTGAWNAEHFSADTTHWGQLYNPGDVPARCVFRVQAITVGAGETEPGTLWFEVGDAEAGNGTLCTVQLSAESASPHGFEIDTDSAIVTDLPGETLLNTDTTLSSNGISGMYLPPKTTTRIRWGENVGSVKVTPMWRWYL